jgi:hypothetical protein
MTTSATTKSGRPIRPRSLQTGRGSAGTPLVPWSDVVHPVRDNVDMPVPSHYSAAPSGDLCTTYKFYFVVWGESRSSVSITSERPHPPRPDLRLRAHPSTARLAMSSSAALHLECSPPAASTLELRATALQSAAPVSGLATAWSSASEQTKHDGVDTERRRDEGRVLGALKDLAGMPRVSMRPSEHSSHCWLHSPSTGHASLGDGLPRNSFFT